MKVIIVIPAYNEEKTITQVIEGVKKYEKNIIVIDDGSIDKTYYQAKKTARNFKNIIVLRHIINLGKGAALKTGCQAAIKLRADIIITMDADGQHSPDDIPKLIQKLIKENLDIVFGSRQINKKMPFIKFLGNKILTNIINLLSGTHLSDTQSGFKAFTSAAYKKIAWQSQDYRIETEIIFNCGKHKLKYSQVPIQTIYKNIYKGTTVLDGIKILINLFKWKLS